MGWQPLELDWFRRPAEKQQELVEEGKVGPARGRDDDSLLPP